MRTFGMVSILSDMFALGAFVVRMRTRGGFSAGILAGLKSGVQAYSKLFPVHSPVRCIKHLIESLPVTPFRYAD